MNDQTHQEPVESGDSITEETRCEWCQEGPCDGYSNVCSRCHRHTGNNHQGHYWSFCKVTGKLRGFHFCCPDNCALEALGE